jgi:hypothetical protein
LSDYLSQHPDIFMARKEMHHFGNDLHFGKQFYRRDRRAYLAEFEDCNGQARAGESSVWYLLSKLAAAEIKAFNPDARIIIMVRKPAELLSALYNLFRCHGCEDLPTFREALAAENDRREGRRIGRRVYFSQGLLYHEAACFTEQIRRYFDVFGRERVHVIAYDDFANRTTRVYGEVLDFLGVDSARIPDSFPVINGNVSAKTVRNTMVRNLLTDPLVRGTAVALCSRLPRPILTALQKAESRLTQMNYRHAERPPVDKDIQEQLCIEFTPEIERLSELLGRDLTHWNRIATAAAQPVAELAADKLRP